VRLRLPLHLLALALLAAGLLSPWVALDPLLARDKSLRDLEALAVGDRLPTFVRDLLAERGFSPGISPDKLWSVVGRDDHPEQFAMVAARERLYAWDFLRVPTSLSVKAAAAASFLALVVGLAALWTGRAAAGTDDDELPSPSSSARTWLASGCALAALLVIVTAPLLDSFGFADKWGLAWLDVLSGARVTFAPRVLVPLGLLLLAVALVLPENESAPDRGDEPDMWR